MRISFSTDRVGALCPAVIRYSDRDHAIAFFEELVPNAKYGLSQTDNLIDVLGYSILTASYLQLAEDIGYLGFNIVRHGMALDPNLEMVYPLGSISSHCSAIDAIYSLRMVYNPYKALHRLGSRLRAPKYSFDLYIWEGSVVLEFAIGSNPTTLLIGLLFLLKKTADWVIDSSHKVAQTRESIQKRKESQLQEMFLDAQLRLLLDADPEELKEVYRNDPRFRKFHGYTSLLLSSVASKAIDDTLGENPSANSGVDPKERSLDSMRRELYEAFEVLNRCPKVHMTIDDPETQD